jgi:ATP-dependent RNA helicase RhlE
MLFSATMPTEIVSLAHKHMQLPINIEIAPSGTAAEKVMQEVFFIEKQNKTGLLEILLNDYHGAVLVFTRTKHGARKLARNVRKMGHAAAEIHSDRSQNQRRDALEGFKSGKYRVLVATDIAARGIDVVGIELVVNYDLPSNKEDYVHRIGRTARAGMAGRAISFATFDQRRDIKDIERLIKTGLAVKKIPRESIKTATRKPTPATKAPARPENKPRRSFKRPSKRKSPRKRRRR